MASNFKKFITDESLLHAVAESSALLATNGGAHIFNIAITTECDNGTIWKLGDWTATDTFAQGTDAPTFAGKILYQAANGNWIVQVTDSDANTILMLSDPLTSEDYLTVLTQESQFYNAVGETGRGYNLAINDRFGLSELGFDGTPEAGKTVSVNATTHKLTVATA